MERITPQSLEQKAVNVVSAAHSACAIAIAVDHKRADNSTPEQVHDAIMNALRAVHDLEVATKKLRSIVRTRQRDWDKKHKFGPNVNRWTLEAHATGGF